jgi:hypothetical protein
MMLIPELDGESELEMTCADQARGAVAQAPVAVAAPAAIGARSTLAASGAIRVLCMASP